MRDLGRRRDSFGLGESSSMRSQTNWRVASSAECDCRTVGEPAVCDNAEDGPAVGDSAEDGPAVGDSDEGGPQLMAMLKLVRQLEAMLWVIRQLVAAVLMMVLQLVARHPPR